MTVRKMGWGGLVAGLLWCAGAVAQDLPAASRLGGDFVLPSTVAATTGLGDFRGRLVLLNFGYTTCPDICPMVLSRLAQVMNGLGRQRDQVQPLFISFDPARDSLERLRAYLAHFGPDFIGLTGTPEQVATVARQYGVVYVAQAGDSAAGTLFSHSDYLFLLDRQGRPRALFSGSDRVEDMVQRVQALLAE